MKNKKVSRVSQIKQNLKKHADWLLTWLVISVFILLILGQFQRVQLTPSLAFYLHDVVIACYLFFLGWFNWKKISTIHSHISWKKHLPVLLLGGWVGLGWLWALISGKDVMSAILYFLRYTSYSLFIFTLFKEDFLKVLIHDYSHKSALLVLFTVTNIGVLVLGLLQYFLLPDTRFLHIYGWDDHFYRLIGTQFDPNFLGLLFIFFLLTLEVLPFLSSKLKKVLRIVLIMAISLTFSRSTYLSFGVALLYLTFHEVFSGRTWQSFKWIALIFLLGVAIVLAPKPAGEGVKLARTSTVISRHDRTDEEISNLSPTDILVGKGLFVPLNSDIAAVETELIPNHAWFTDNLLVNVFVSLGGVGVVLLLLVITRYYSSSYSNAFWVATWIALITHSMFNNSLLQPFVWLFFGLTIGIMGSHKEKKIKV